MELLLSDDLETAVRSLWHRLHAAGLPSLATHTHATNRPHLTLVAAESVPQHIDFGLPLPVTLGGVRMLGKALVREVVASCELRTLQAAVWQSSSGANPMHAPGAWLPHVSLALNVRADRRAAALGVLGTVPPMSGELVAARTYDSKARTVTTLAGWRAP